MGECISTPEKLVVDPIIEDNFKRNQETSLKQLNQSNRTCASNLSETGTFLAVDSIHHDKGRIELYEVRLADSGLEGVFVQRKFFN
mmetsp:Transcript_5074/g.5928  ORF Transcript_5074/g.5928 Transcript_5074/m.5928 type:complete len:86 (-) Transcript_5074:838-1095(-)